MNCSVAGRAKDIALDQLVRVLDRVPLVSGIKNDLSGLRSLLYERRAPRIAVLGRSGSGRSSVLRALIEREPAGETLTAEHGQWVRIEHEGATIRWLEIDIDHDAARSQWKEAMERRVPDLVLLTFDPDDLKSAAQVVERAQHLLRDLPNGTEPLRVLALLTKVDSLPESGPGVDAVRDDLDEKIHALNLRTDPVRAISTFSSGGLDALSEAIVLALPEQARLEAARALTRASEARLRIANEIVQACTSVSVTVGLTPIPFSDSILLGPLQAMMVSALAYLSGRAWDRKTIAQWIASLGVVGGLGVGLRFTARTVAKLVPGAGPVVSAGIAGAGTTAMGQSAIKYFLRA
ncbi:MAG: hypothetical protein PVH21_03320 [Myxococcales bacterium]|jgi:uncharacterized protein (DUF697 family)